MTSDADTLRSEIRGHLPDPLPYRLGVAISGGSDSTALLHLLSGIARGAGVKLYSATVDHGLRPESGAEAASVASLAHSLGIPHQTLKWQDWDGSGNLQNQARRARYRLLGEWAGALDLAAIALGHTADDQAETLLMRLARSAGVTGLSGMATARIEGDLTLLRPMLSITRARLRAYLTGQGLGWVDDPSNQDRRFDRIKAREALNGLDQIGITSQGLSRVADNLAKAREALARYAQESARRHVQVIEGDLCFDRTGFASLPDEIRRRLVVASVMWLTGRDYPPRQTATDHAVQAILTGQTTTLAGCQVVADRKKVWICRELRAVGTQIAQPGTVWDGRCVLIGPETTDAEIRPLGENGILQLSDWRAASKPRAVVVTTPAVWVNTTVIAAPLAGFANGWTLIAPSGRPQFYDTILSH